MRGNLTHSDNFPFQLYITINGQEIIGIETAVSEFQYNLTNICQHEKTSESPLQAEVAQYQIGKALQKIDFNNCSNELSAEEIVFEKTSLSNENFCADQHTVVYVKSVAHYIDAEFTCKQIRGSHLSEEDVTTFKQKIDAIKDGCLTDNIHTWIETDNKHDFDSWCSVLKTGESFGWRPCHKPLQCFFCKVPRNFPIVMFGETDSFDRHYNLRKSENGEIYLKGVQNSFVKREKNYWILDSPVHSIVCLMNESATPFVRALWNCSEGTRLFAFSPCSQHQFACDSGNCLKYEVRCDGDVDCDDGSDEKECVPLIKSVGYDKDQFPPVPDGKKVIDVRYSFSVYSLDDVKTSNFYIEVDLGFFIAYKDIRLKVLNPHEDEDFECSSIWKPSILMLDNPKNGHWVSPPDDFIERCAIVSPNKDYLSIEYQDPFMGKHTQDNEGNPIKYSPIHL